MPLNRMEKLIQPLSDAEFQQTMKRKNQLAQYIFEGNHPQYSVYHLIDNVPVGKSDPLFYVGYYIGNGNRLFPVVLNNENTSLDMQDILFKIINIPTLPPYDPQFNYADNIKRHNIFNELHQNKNPYALLAINAAPDDLVFSLFSHHSVFNPSEVLAEVQDNAMHQLTCDTHSLISFPKWNNILL